MFAIPQLSSTPPDSVEEALLQARRLLSLAGIEDAQVCITQPPHSGESLRGACLEASIPVASIQAAAGKTAEPLAASQGVKIAHTRLSFENSGAAGLALSIAVEVGVRVFGATVKVVVRGVAETADGEHIECRELMLDAGSGMFAGMATALIRPKLDALEGQRFNLAQIAGVPVRLLHLECTRETPETLRIGIRFA